MNTEKTLLEATVVIPCRSDEALFAEKVRKIGAGCVNGYGGGPEKGDKDLRHTAVRELFEETDDGSGQGGIIALTEDLVKVAIIDFHNTKSDGTVFVCRVHFYLLFAWKGDFKDSKEMVNPSWHRLDSLPLDRMMPADRDYMPLILSGKKVKAKAYYGPLQKTLLKPTEVTIVDKLEE